MARVGSMLAWLFLICATSTVHAQADPTVHARSNQLFAAGKKLLAEGKLVAACESFAESHRLEPRGGTLLNLGLCHEQQGQLLAAHRELTEALALARRDARKDREPLLLEHLATIEARLAFFEFPSDAAAPSGLVWHVDGALLPDAAAQAWPVEPGAHVVRVEAPGFEPTETTWQLAAGTRQRVSTPQLRAQLARAEPQLPVPPPTAAANAAQPTAESRHATSAALTRTALAPVTARPFATLRTTALIVGAVGLAAALVTGALALGQRAIVHRDCPQRMCEDAAALRAVGTGRALAIANDIAVGVGVLGVGAWVLLPGGVLNPAASGEHAYGLRLHATY